MTNRLYSLSRWLYFSLSFQSNFRCTVCSSNIVKTEKNNISSNVSFLFGIMHVQINHFSSLKVTYEIHFLTSHFKKSSEYFCTDTLRIQENFHILLQEVCNGFEQNGFFLYCKISILLMFNEVHFNRIILLRMTTDVWVIWFYVVTEHM